VTGKTGRNPGSPGAGISCRQDAISKSAFSGSTQNEVRGVKKYFDHESTAYRVFQRRAVNPSGGRGSRRAGNPSGGRGSRRAAKPREGEAPAEPPNLGRARLPPSRTSVLSIQSSVIAKSPVGRLRLPPSRGNQRPDKRSAQQELRPPKDRRSAQRELRPPKGVNTRGKAIVAAHRISR
jgi:hypothetical protein